MGEVPEQPKASSVENNKPSRRIDRLRHTDVAGRIPRRRRLAVVQTMTRRVRDSSEFYGHGGFMLSGYSRFCRLHTIRSMRNFSDFQILGGVMQRVSWVLTIT